MAYQEADFMTDGVADFMADLVAAGE